MKRDRVGEIAEAVLYEGYMLYPYRASAVKNQQRWNFGVLCPRSYSEQQNGSDAWMMQTECLVQGNSTTELNVKVRFLQIVERSIAKLLRSLDESPSGQTVQFQASEFALVDKLELDDQAFVPWEEAAEREVSLLPLLCDGPAAHRSLVFKFPAGRELDPILDRDGRVVGLIIREWKTLYGSVEASFEQQRDGVCKATVRIRNLNEYEMQEQRRADILVHSLISAHTILCLGGGQFFSLLDPSEDLKELAAECKNIGTWPVLVGDQGDRDMMLSSPIILYDYPQVAAESPGSLFDGTEIDEILSLRILTMTDDEKREMRHSDQRAREILERTESLPPEQFLKLHGAVRGLRPLGPNLCEPLTPLGKEAQ